MKNKPKPTGKTDKKYTPNRYPKKPVKPIKQEAAKTEKNGDEIRLNKYIANSGVCSRRDADIYIASGNVTVNGKIINELGHKVKLTDEVKFDGAHITPEKKVYVLLNKPKDFTTEMEVDNKKSIFDLVKAASKSVLLPVGRLDKNASGLILLTNDRPLITKLTHHQTPVKKIYHVNLDKNLKSEDLKKLEDGIKLEEGFVKPDEVSYVENAPKNEIGVQLRSSKNNVVRLLFEHLGYQVLKLDRVIYAGLTKKDLDRGRWRYLTPQEVINLKNLK